MTAAIHHRKSSVQSKRVKAGSAAESLVDRANAQLARLGIAYVRKLPTPMKIIGKTPRGLLAVHDAKSGVDYIGNTSQGIAVYAEAKHVSKWSFPLARLETHQLDELRRAQRDGCLAVLVIVIGVNDMVAINAAELEFFVARALHGGRKSISREELERYRVNGLDYLECCR